MAFYIERKNTFNDEITVVLDMLSYVIILKKLVLGLNLLQFLSLIYLKEKSSIFHNDSLSTE